MKRRALISVSDKRGVIEFARGLVELGWEIVSTGGTARALRDAGVAVLDVSELTRHPEMMDGRVKTLHPAVHAGLLARRDRADDLEALGAQGYAPIDLVAVNLYPFHEAAARGAAIPEAMEQVDIGGPTMLRASAKNHAGVIVVVDPGDYDEVLAALAQGGPDLALRRRLAARVFAHTAAYDAAIAAYFDARAGEAADPGSRLPESLRLALRKVQDLRYGENPDQPAAFYAEADADPGSLAGAEQLQGKELSFNNLLDADAALAAVSAWAGEDVAACVIVKHTTPCGVAVAGSVADAYRDALACDPVSAFGGIIAFNVDVDEPTAAAMAELFLELVIAPDFSAGARAVLERKKNLRLLRLPLIRSPDDALDIKRVRGGFLAQARMRMSFPEDEWRTVSTRQPTADELHDLRFAWRVSAMVKSNAIVIARYGRTLGIGAGQMSRVDASRIAVMKAADHGHDIVGAALASDAFFPFRDGVDAAARAGIRAIIQPGGSVRDDEVIAAANEHDLAMIFTSRRLFRH